MKRAIGVAFAIMALMFTAVAGASAGNMPRVRADVPFAFYAGNQLLPAGEYVFEMLAITRGAPTGSTLLIRTRDASIAYFLAARPDWTGKPDGAAFLVFHKYGDKCFLSEVHQPELSVGVAKNRMEKELRIALQNAGLQQIAVSAR